MTLRKLFALLVFSLIGSLIGACATPSPFPRPGCCSPSPESAAISETLTGDALFAKTYAAHGGENLSALHDLNVSLDGRWKFLITRIQPLVTDHRYRVRSQERIQPAQGVYAAFYEGPAGTKRVFRNRERVRVWYDDVETTDPDVLASTALTADSFLLFSLGPLAPAAQVAAAETQPTYSYLEERREGGRRYHLIHRQLQPGLGFSPRDELVFWIDGETFLTFRVEITLEGYRTTQGAHVDVTFEAFERHSGVLLPVEFNERVRAPVAIQAHRWWVTGIDVNRGWQPSDLDSKPWSPGAEKNARQRDVEGASR